MGWWHRPGDRVRLVYRDRSMPLHGRTGTVLARAGRRLARLDPPWLEWIGKPPERSPRNYLVQVDGIGPVVVPGGNLRKED